MSIVHCDCYAVVASQRVKTWVLLDGTVTRYDLVFFEGARVNGGLIDDDIAAFKSRSRKLLSQMNHL